MVGAVATLFCFWFGRRLFEGFDEKLGECVLCDFSALRVEFAVTRVGEIAYFCRIPNCNGDIVSVVGGDNSIFSTM